MSHVERVLVVVPAHDEEEVLARCLDHVAAAVDHVVDQVEVRTVVVLDDCTDGTAAIAGARDVEVVSTAERNVGAARALGVEVAARDVAEPRTTWMATTDADCRVGVSWLADHLAAACAGHDALVGRVLPDPDDLVPAVLREWRRRHRSPGHHVHGANLGVRLSAYRAVGGFAPLPTGEDVALVAALRARGVPVAQDGAPVVTSGRVHARAPDGFAAYLRALALEVTAARST